MTNMNIINMSNIITTQPPFQVQTIKKALPRLLFIAPPVVSASFKNNYLNDCASLNPHFGGAILKYLLSIYTYAAKESQRYYIEISHETIAKKVGCSTRTVKRALTLFRKWGIVSWSSRGRYAWDINTYRFSAFLFTAEVVKTLVLLFPALYYWQSPSKLSTNVLPNKAPLYYRYLNNNTYLFMEKSLSNRNKKSGEPPGMVPNRRAPSLLGKKLVDRPKVRPYNAYAVQPHTGSYGISPSPTPPVKEKRNPHIPPPELKWYFNKRGYFCIGDQWILWREYQNGGITDQRLIAALVEWYKNKD